ncbi:MAG: DUF3152 domain-containing protein [Acidimicrobiales bacterium]
MRGRRATLGLGLGLAMVGVACDGGAGAGEGPLARSPETTATGPAAEARAPIEVRYRIERRVGDAATAGFGEVVRATLDDPRGWTGADFRLVEDAGAPYLVVLAEGDEVDRLCAPYRTAGRFSCQNGPTVAINADRWRTATDKWTGDVATYRQMLVNHEVGHLLGRHHPPGPQCPAAGRPAPVMAQQSTELDGCLPNPWPLPGELEAAARHDEPLAPPYEP